MLRDWLRIKRFIERELPAGPGIVCVDLDSVLVYHNSDWGNTHVGRVLPFGRKLCQLLRGHGKRIIVLTARPREQHHAIWNFLCARGFGVEDVTNIKPAAQAYFDDRAVRIPKNWR